MKVDAEYFLENNNKMFEFNHNPFKYDIASKEIDNFETPLPDTLMLKADSSTLRVAPWVSKEAYVISDIYHADDQNQIEFAPRNMLQKSI